MDTRGEFLERYKGRCQAAMDGGWNTLPWPKAGSARSAVSLSRASTYKPSIYEEGLIYPGG